MTSDPIYQTGQVVDKYQLFEKVGEGGMARVYRGRHLTLERDVAVKILHPHLSSVERNRIRFEREARAIEALSHENILKIFDYSGKENAVCYIVTEFIEGVTLKEVLEEQTRMPSEIVGLIGYRLASALAYAHGRGIIHRDIKPENVMIRRDGVIKLMDFGIARVLDENSVTLTGGLVGSPAYMSPEQAADAPLDLRTDLFSLGTLLYRCVTGMLPFNGTSAPVILRAILEGDYPDPLDIEPGMAPTLARIIERLLQNAPDERYPSADALKADLGAFLAESEFPPRDEELKRYLADPEAYCDALNRRLVEVLTEVGRRAIASGNALGALKHLNRVLSLDEDNAEALALVRGLHDETPGDRRIWRKGAVFIGIGILLVLTGIGWQRAFFASFRTGAPEVGIREPEKREPSALRSRPIEPSLPLDEHRGVEGMPGPVPTLPGDLQRGSDARGPLHAGRLQAEVGPASGNERADAAKADAAARPQKGGRGDSIGRRGASSGRPGGGDEKGEGLTPAARAPGERGTPGDGRKPIRDGSTPIGKGVAAKGADEKGADGERGAEERTDGLRPPVPVRSALVNIRAVPFAEIFIDGTSYGDSVLRRDPIELSPGTYTLRLVHPLCEPIEERITLESGEIFERVYQMKPLPASLVVEHVPDPSAEVFLDGVSLGRFDHLKQPISIPKARDEHRLEIRSAQGWRKSWILPGINPGGIHSIDAAGKGSPP